jgi:hypothetical protein
MSDRYTIDTVDEHGTPRRLIAEQQYVEVTFADLHTARHKGLIEVESEEGHKVSTTDGESFVIHEPLGDVRVNKNPGTVAPGRVGHSERPDEAGRV